MAVYAVANGREVGVFYDWSEVEPLIKGFKGAKHKKCGDEIEALAFIEEHNLQTKQLADLQKKKIEDRKKAAIGEYTPENMFFSDGVYSVNNKTFGGGIFILLSDGQTFNIGTASPDATMDGDKSPQHIFGEMKSVMLGVKMMNEMFKRKSFTIVYDFRGVRDFLSLNGKKAEWDVDSDFSSQYKKFMEKYIEKNKLDITFRKEKSHTNQLGNDMADQLASESLTYHQRVKEQLYVL